MMIFKYNFLSLKRDQKGDALKFGLGVKILKVRKYISEIRKRSWKTMDKARPKSFYGSLYQFLRTKEGEKCVLHIQTEKFGSKNDIKDGSP